MELHHRRISDDECFDMTRCDDGSDDASLVVMLLLLLLMLPMVPDSTATLNDNL